MNLENNKKVNEHIEWCLLNKEKISDYIKSRVIKTLIRKDQ